MSYRYIGYSKSRFIKKMYRSYSDSATQKKFSKKKKTQEEVKKTSDILFQENLIALELALKVARALTFEII